MNKKRLLIGVPVVAGLALLSMIVVGAEASSPQSQPALPGGSGSATAAAPTFWTSGWTPISQNQILTFDHNLGRPPEQLAVELWFRDTDAGGIGINRAGYGGLESAGNWYGAYWRNLTANTIQVHRLPNDINADRVRVQVWVVSSPDYDSGWRNLGKGANYFDHGLTGTPTDLSVTVWFSGTLHGIHHFSYGGLTDGDLDRGAYWWMTNNSVVVYRRADDDDANATKVRVVVVHSAPPDYDSLVALGSWQPITQGVPFTFTHNLNVNPDLLLVRGECRDNALSEVVLHQMWAGGDEWGGGLFRGAHLQNLTANSIQFVRQALDQDCDYARVVIYRRVVQVYLPLVIRNAP